ncbi:MAG: hypothetical protein R2747_13575 [Pyrinomonadaceae bacterium]
MKTTLKTTNEFLESLGLRLDQSARRGIRLEIKDGDLSIDGYRFPSDAEKRRYIELRIKANRGEIHSLLVAGPAGVSYRLRDGCDTLRYCPTFIYQDKGGIVLEDARKIQSEDNLRKIELMKKQCGINVKVVKYDRTGGAEHVRT